MSHGEKGILSGRDDSQYKVEELWEPFTADRCPSLAGKPKLFFIQVRRVKMEKATLLKKNFLIWISNL